MLADDFKTYVYVCQICIPSELGVLQNPRNEVKVKLNQTVVNRRTVPVIRNSFPALVVRQVALFALNSEEALQSFLV